MDVAYPQVWNTFSELWPLDFSFQSWASGHACEQVDRKKRHKWNLFAIGSMNRFHADRKNRQVFFVRKGGEFSSANRWSPIGN